MTSIELPHGSVSRNLTLASVLRQRAAAEANKEALTFLAAGQDQAQRVTYGELDQRARAIAASLLRLGVAGQRVVILQPPGVEFVASLFDCFYAGAIAVPAYPPGSARRTALWERLRSILADAQPIAALTSSELQPQLYASLPLTKDEHLSLNIMTTDAPSGDIEADAYVPLERELSDVACLQYTSGSTRDPRGVMITHGNLVANMQSIAALFGHSDQSRGVIWLPPYHDMGLMGILQPIYAGFPVTLMPPAAFVQQPLRWLQAISDYRGTSSGGPNFAYDLCVEKISPQQRGGLDLSSWQVAFNGAEPIDPQTLDRFASAFASCGFRREAFLPCYGLAEATLMVTGAGKGGGMTAIDAPDGKQVVECGKPPSGTEHDVVIVDPNTRTPVGEGGVGEIWTAGPNVGIGYWNNIDATGDAFGASLAGADSTTGRYLRTGDLGFMRSGELFVTGRLKDLIIIRGVNHHPHEIERTMQASHHALRQGAAAALDTVWHKYPGLSVVQELSREHRRSDPDEIIRCIRDAIALDHEVVPRTVTLVGPGRIPRTPSGKVQRYRCRELLLSGDWEVIAHWQDREAQPSDEDVAAGSPLESFGTEAGEIEQWLLRKTAVVLKRPAHEIDPAEPFASLGMESIDAVDLAMSISEVSGRRLPESIFWDYPSVRELAVFLASPADDTQQAPTQVERG